MYLWDANILRAFGQGHATLRSYLLRVPWSEIALPSVVIAEVLRGRCDFALKATPAEAPLAHRRLLDTQQMLSQFHIVVFNAPCATVMERPPAAASPTEALCRPDDCGHRRRGPACPGHPQSGGLPRCASPGAVGQLDR